MDRPRLLRPLHHDAERPGRIVSGPAPQIRRNTTGGDRKHSLRQGRVRRSRRDGCGWTHHTRSQLRRDFEGGAVSGNMTSVVAIVPYVPAPATTAARESFADMALHARGSNRNLYFRNCAYNPA